ncbi:MAG: RNA polymerase sigma factor [Candidatus Binatus sp.]|uniref:RNA polymerase sigma factor n=1 Tax=Candidatus Binatus sp. TaxID=2811406 RepID=UPI0027233293|nr:RNA polymerase sigma factor [Candidatus Binatus sp.]MDO8433984.1 RNA polymerase sigma factor [Candidatus Binatus sp.]
MGAVEKLNLPPPFDDAVRSMEREIMRFLVRSTGNRDDALDLFQETWLRAYRAYPTLQSEDGLRPWIFRIASNLCRNRVRDKTRRKRVIDDELADADAFAELASFEARGGPDGVLHLKRAIAKLPGNQGKALVMRKFAGLAYEEIGAALDCSADSARASVYLALKKLKTDG